MLQAPCQWWLGALCAVPCCPQAPRHQRPPRPAPDCVWHTDEQVAGPALAGSLLEGKPDSPAQPESRHGRDPFLREGRQCVQGHPAEACRARQPSPTLREQLQSRLGAGRGVARTTPRPCHDMEPSSLRGLGWEEGDNCVVSRATKNERWAGGVLAKGQVPLPCWESQAEGGGENHPRWHRAEEGQEAGLMALARASSASSVKPASQVLRYLGKRTGEVTQRHCSQGSDQGTSTAWKEPGEGIGARGWASLEAS